MKKAGEKAKSFFIHALFLVMILVGLYFIATSTANLTGYVVLDASTAKEKLQAALTGSALMGQISQTSICVIINDPEQPLSLQAVKSSTGWKVSEMIDYCSGAGYEDVIIQFPGYDSFSRMMDNPSPRSIANGAIAQEFQILPSRYVELGGNVICDGMFKAKYCDILNSMASPEQLIEGDLACCIGELTRAQKKLLQEHLDEGGFEDEVGILEQPSGIVGMFGMNMTTSIIALGVVVLVLIVIILGVMMGRGKAPAAKGPGPGPAGAPGAAVPGVMGAAAQPGMAGVQGAPAESPEITELRNYVTQVIGEGYDPEEVKTHLLEIGWDMQTADKVIYEAQGRLQ